MRIGGLNKTSLIDYPGKVSAVIFTQGCNFRCPFCHNPELVYSDQFLKPIPEEDIFEFLQKRKNQLDGLVISGGEPTIQSDLKDFIEKVKKLGYKIKLDTNGSDPDILSILINENLIDFVAMDVKAPFEKYSQLTGVHINNHTIQKSLKIIQESRLDYEFRTTYFKKLLNDEDIQSIKTLLDNSEKYRVQEYIPLSK